MATNNVVDETAPQHAPLSRKLSLSRRHTSPKDFRLSAAGASSRDDIFDELDEINASSTDSTPVPSTSPPSARTINVMVSPSEPLFFNCADPGDGGEQITLFRTLSKDPAMSDVWPECNADDVFYEEDEDCYSAEDVVADDITSSPPSDPSMSHSRESIRRRTRLVSEHSIPRLRRMTSSLLTTPAQRRSVLSSVESACSRLLMPISDVPSTTTISSSTAAGDDSEKKTATTTKMSVAVSPVSRTKTATHAQLQRAMSKSAEFQTGWKRFKGVLLALAAGFVFTFSAVAQKYLLETMTSTQIGLIRFILLTGFMSPFFLIRRINPFSLIVIKQHGWMLLLRGIIGGLCFQLRTYAFAKLPLGDATTIMFSSPIFVGLIAKLVLNERYQKIYLLTTVTTLLGCMLISRPKVIFEPSYSSLPAVIITNTTSSAVEEENDASVGRLLGSAAALASSLLAACTFVVLRKLRRVDAMIVVFYFGFVGSLISFGLTFLTSHMPMPTSLAEYCWILVLAVSGNLGQWLFTRSLHYENANLVSLTRTFDIVWAFAAQMALFNVLPHILSILGASIVTLSVMFLGARKLVESLDTDSAIRTYLAQSRVCLFCFPPLRKSARAARLTTALAAVAATAAAAAAADTVLETRQYTMSRTVSFPDDTDNNNDSSTSTLHIYTPLSVSSTTTALDAVIDVGPDKDVDVGASSSSSPERQAQDAAADDLKNVGA